MGVLMKEISRDLQLEIFEKVFLEIIETTSLRWKLQEMIESRNGVDQAELELKMRKLELEIIQKGGIVDD